MSKMHARLIHVCILIVRLAFWVMICALYVLSVGKLFERSDDSASSIPRAPVRIPKKPMQGRLYAVNPSREGVVTLAFMRRYDAVGYLIHVHHSGDRSPGLCRTRDDTSRPFVNAERHRLYDLHGYGKVYFHDPIGQELKWAGARPCDCAAATRDDYVDQ